MNREKEYYVVLLFDADYIRHKIFARNHKSLLRKGRRMSKRKILKFLWEECVGLYIQDSDGKDIYYRRLRKNKRRIITEKTAAAVKKLFRNNT